MRKKIVVLLCFFFLWQGLICSQFEKFTVAAVRTEIPPVIDGILDDEVWKNAPSVGDFIQFEPDKDKPASVRTVAKILYDNDYIYIAFLCYDPEPEKIELETRRDRLMMGVDSVTVDLDTFNDDRTMYYFRTNPLGVQHDGRVTDNGLIADTNWDGIWKSAGARIEEGWSAEMAISFTAVKFQSGKNQTWGIQFSRYFPRRFEKNFWTGPFEEYKKVSVNGSLTGLDLEMTKKKIEIIPHSISRIQESEKTGFEAGLDASYAFSQSISGYLTINPDFSTVEADREQVNLTRFELHLPEKRNFFLEGNDAYQQRIRLFYSRKIADIYGGIKLYGKRGRYEISALSAQTRGGDEEGASTNFSVLRLKRDIWEFSSIGFLAANRLTNGRNQGTVGLDVLHYFTDILNFTGQFAISYRDGSSSDLAFFLRPSYDSRTFHTHLRYTYLGKYFGDNANAVGFIRDDNRHEFDSAVKKIFWLRKWGLDRIEYNSNYNIYWGMDKTLRSWDVWQSLTLDLQNKLRFKFRHQQEYKLYEKKFRNHNSSVDIGYNTREWQSVSISYQNGRNFDSDFTLIAGKLRQYLSRNLSLEYTLTNLSLSPDPENESTWIHVIVANKYFTKDLFLKLFYQINSVIDKRNIQVVFVYRFQPPFGLFQLAYQKGTARFGEKGVQGHTLFLKLAYVF
ncbi:hypothetical protein LCGC14_0917740 [marine sediment metagenome]|uniref:Uncharacterized protein n=1 Tax=marine sediment metagenome TaxID=412755 RepID=A0A0F9NRT1_9ZZZZ|nr:hypothetical protein [Candidatus Aminicenantes bacterium]HEB34409.1 hypothetical protein [Candidatus Aminicenantes bacterium]